MWRLLGGGHITNTHHIARSSGIGRVFNRFQLVLSFRKTGFQDVNLVPLLRHHLAQILNLLILMGNGGFYLMELFFIHKSVYTIKCKQQKKEMMFPRLKSYAPGFALAFLIGLGASMLSARIGIPSSLLALFIGIALSSLYKRSELKKGIDWSAKFILRVGVAFLGFRITFDNILTLGWSTALMVIIGITATITIGILCAKLFGLRKEFGALTGGAVSICGASAAMAITSILPDHKDKDRDLSLAIIGITAFSTTAMVLYPFIGNLLGLNPMEMSLFLGGTIHDVAQTAGAGYSISEEVGDLAILTKMIRVAFLLPVVLALMLYFKTRNEEHKPNIPLPIFLFVFIVFIIANSLLPIPAIITDNISILSRQALITAIVAIGLKTNIRDVLAVGVKPILLITIQTITMAAVILTCIAYL